MKSCRDADAPSRRRTPMTQQRSPLRPGERLSEFVLDERLAMGGMAEIWSARPAAGGPAVALKLLQPQLTGDSEFRAMFLDEVNIALRLRHENIVRVHDGRYENGHFFLVMDLVDGMDLRRVLKQLAQQRRWVPTPVGLSIGAQIARALAYAHLRKDDRGRALGIVHRDISPHNVMLGFDGSVRLLDFGIARARERHARTRPGVVKGKTGYMAPEQATGGPVDQRADVFATGIVLWETLAMRRLFHGANDLETMNKVIDARVPDLCRINETVPPDAAALIHQMLARSPKDRPASMREVEPQLKRALLRAFEPLSFAPSRRAAWLQSLAKASPVRRRTAVQEPTTSVDDAPTRPD